MIAKAGVDLAQFWRCTASLRYAVAVFELVYREVVGAEPICTRLMDPVSGESGIHLEGRGADFRSSGLTGVQIETIVFRMNALLPRSDGFPTLLYHAMPGPDGKVGTSDDGAPHFHLQVPAFRGIVYSRVPA